jgi:hypothetical protein
MKRILSRLGLIGLVAAGAMGASVAVSAAQCMPGTTDCGPYQYRQYRGHASGIDVWVVGRDHQPQWRHNGNHWPKWRNHRKHQPKWHHPRRGKVTIGIWGGPFYDPFWYVPQYRYVEPVPRYRVINLSAAHIKWCYARYKTYRASDNTYKPTKHTRRQCISPYS